MTKIIKVRWKFYVIGYILGYVFPLLYDGIPNNLYLMPIKITGIIFAILIGTALYYGSIHIPLFEVYRRSLKYVVVVIILIILSYILTILLNNNYNIDISPFTGMDFLK